MQMATHLRGIILSPVTGLTVPRSSTLWHGWHDFRKKKLLNTKCCVMISSTTFVWNHISFSEEFSEVVSYKYTCLHVKYPLFLSDFNQTLIFPTDFRNTQIANFMKIRSVGTVFPIVETEMTKLIFLFRFSTKTADVM
jgi:hypothetical protein